MVVVFVSLTTIQSRRRIESHVKAIPSFQPSPTLAKPLKPFGRARLRRHTHDTSCGVHSCNFRWREAEAFVDGSTLPTQGSVVIVQGLRLSPRQFTHYVQYINAGIASCLAIKDSSVRIEWEARKFFVDRSNNIHFLMDRNKLRKLVRLGGSRAMIREP